jgi:integrase
MNTLRFQAELVNGEPRIKAVERNPAKEIRAGSAVVKIFGRGPYSIAWRESAGGRRQMRMRTKWAAAKRFAEEKAIEIANGQTAMSQFTEADRASYKRALELLAPTGQPLELAVGIYTDSVQKLGGIRLEDAVAFFLEHRPPGYKPIPLPDLVTQFLEDRKPEISDAWYTALANPLNRLGIHFREPLHAFRGPAIRDWLRGLKDKKGKLVGSRTRHNYRAALQQLVTWAQANDKLPRVWGELKHVPDSGAAMESEIRILTADQILKFLAHRQKAEEGGRAKKTLMPFLLIQAFAGVRHEEMWSKKKKKKGPLLEWSDINLEDRTIYIRKSVAKTGNDRIVPISENLAAWLKPYVRKSGPVCTVQPSNAITAIKRAVGIPAGKNESRNSLRKTWISNRLGLVKNIAQVAEEAGNSAAKIRSNYKRPRTESQAKAYFNLWPTHKDVLQLDLF